MPTFDDTLILNVDGKLWSGWTSFRVTRGVERVPSDFVVSGTERFPGQPDKTDIEPGQPVKLMIGSDLTLTGYVDAYGASLSPSDHSVSITGRGKCQDLVDCSAVFNGMQVSSQTTLEIARLLAKPFGINVVSLNGPGPVIPQFNAILTETPFQVIERITRFSALLAYEGRDGNLILATAASSEMASGFAEGVNVEAARVVYSMAERYSEITVIDTSIDTIFQTDPHPAGVIGLSTWNRLATVKEADLVKNARGGTVSRYRPHLVVTEHGSGGFELSEKRAKWEIARRYGRSQAVTVTCDSWRDSAGVLWEPNTLARVHLPSLKLANRKWLISEVTFTKDMQRGTAAEVTLMPPEAFQPEPILLVPFDKQVADDLAQNSGLYHEPGSKGPGGALGHA